MKYTKPPYNQTTFLVTEQPQSHQKTKLHIITLMQKASQKQTLLSSKRLVKTKDTIDDSMMQKNCILTL